MSVNTVGTEYQTVIRSRSISLTSSTGKVDTSSGTRIIVAPTRQEEKISNVDRSKCRGAWFETRSSSIRPAHSAAQFTNVSEFRCEIITPFGVPVEPDVYRIRAVSVSTTKFSGRGVAGCAMTSSHDTTVTPGV